MGELVDLKSHARYRPDVVGLACARVAAARAQLGRSLQEFAMELGRILTWQPSPDAIASWERKTVPPPGDVLAACELLLNSPAGGLHILDGAPGIAPRTLEIEDRSLPVRGNSAQVQLAPTDDVFEVLSRIQKLRRGTVHPGIVSQIEHNLQAIIAQYERLDHSSLLPVLLKQRAWIEAILDQCSHPGQRLQLLRVAGVTAGVLGYLAVGRGDFALARAYCLEAFELGDFTQDANLQAWARGMQSFCEYYAGQYDEALYLAQDGLKYAHSGPQSVRLTINGAARALGKLGDVNGVHRAVDQAYSLLSQNNAPGGIPSSIALECYSAAQTSSNAATAYVSLGIPDKVQYYTELALPEINKSDSPWSRSLVLIDVAFSLIRAREADLDQAISHVLDAAKISAGRPIISVQQRTSEFARAAIDRWGRTPEIGAILDAASAMKARNE